MSKLWTLQTQDFVKGLVVTVITAVLTLILQVLQNGAAINWKAVGITALIAGIAYILKNLATDQNGKLLGKIQIEQNIPVTSTQTNQ